MDKRERFIKELQSYHIYLTSRFEKGYEYLKSNPEDQKAINLYESIVEELSVVEWLINYYK